MLIIRQEVEAGRGCPVDSCPTPVIFMLHHDKLRPLKGRITTILFILSPSHLHGFGTRSSVKPFFGNLSPIPWCPHVSMHAEVTVKWRSSSRISIDLTHNFLCYFNNLVWIWLLVFFLKIKVSLLIIHTTFEYELVHLSGSAICLTRNGNVGQLKSMVSRFSDRSLVGL